MKQQITFDRDDPPVLGANPFVGLTREQALAPYRLRRLMLASTTCGLGGVPGTPAALGLLALPLRYYSPPDSCNGCTAPSPTPTAGSCASGSPPAGHGRRQCGAT